MKTRILKPTIVALFAMVIGIGTAFGQPSTSDPTSSATPAVESPTAIKTPLTGNSVSSAKIFTTKTRNSPKPARSDSYTGSTIQVVPIWAPSQTSPESVSVLTALVNDWRNNSITNNRGYGFCDGRITTNNLIYSSTALQELVDIKSLNGKNEISLGEVTMESVSTAGALNDTYTVNGRGYGPAAIGILENGTVISSGDPNQKVARIIFIVQMKLFNDDPVVVGTWVMAQTNFTVDYTVRISGDSTSAGHASVSIAGYNNSQPHFTITKEGLLTLHGGDQNRPYQILTGPTVKGPWETWETMMYTGDSVLVTPMTEGMKIFRAKSLP